MDFNFTLQISTNISIENFTSPGVHSSNNFITRDFLLNALRNCFLCLNLLIRVPTHSYILWIIAQEKRIQSEFFNINLIVCEIIYSQIFFCYLFQVLTHLELLQNFVQGLGVTGCPLFQCLMCLERYLAVVHPVTFLKYKPLRYRVICCTVAWIITLGSCVGSITPQIASNLMAYSWYFSVQYFFFLSIQLCCLVAVLRALKQSGPGERKREKVENNMKRRAFHLILITTVTFIIMFSPFIITGFLCVMQVFNETEVSLIWFLSVCCYILAGFVQPVLYLHRAGKLFCLYSG